MGHGEISDELVGGGGADCDVRFVDEHRHVFAVLNTAGAGVVGDISEEGLPEFTRGSHAQVDSCFAAAWTASGVAV